MFRIHYIKPCMYMKSTKFCSSHSISHFPKKWLTISCLTLNVSLLSYLRMISASHRPANYCRDFFTKARYSVMISDNITDSVVSLLKVSCKNKFLSAWNNNVSLDRKPKGEKTKRRTHPSEGVRSLKSDILVRTCVDV